jgi:hypothetical protein
MAKKFVSVPKIEQNLVEIPVSLPDDDLLISRLKIRDPQLLDMILQDMLSLTYMRGELFTVLLHPERIMYYKNSIDHLFEMALDLKPKVWVTSMQKIAEWWQEKRRSTIDIRAIDVHKYQVKVRCLDRSTLLCKNPKHKNGSFYSGYEIIKERFFNLESPKIPLVGIPANSSPQLQDLLVNEGIPFERSFERDKYSVFISEDDYCGDEDERKILRKIEQSPTPLLRFWRWPDDYRSALALTGDIDAFTIFDFLPRLFHRQPDSLMNRDERKVQKDFFN